MVRVVVVMLAGLAMGARAEEELFVVGELPAACIPARDPAIRVMAAMGFVLREDRWTLLRFDHRRKTENWRQVMAWVGPVTEERPASTKGTTAATMVLEQGNGSCRTYLVIDWAGYPEGTAGRPVWRWMKSNGRMEQRILELMRNEVEARR